MIRVGRAVIKPGITFLLLIMSFSVMGQAHRVQFGKNRIQYKYFDWQYYYSDNFEVYYYDGGEDLAKRSIEYLESEFSRITETIGYPPYAKTRVFLYNSIGDKQQSNVGVKGKDFTVGGQTNFVKSQVEIAYSGDYSSFRKKLVFGVTDMLVQEMLFGGNIAEMFQTTFSTPIPRWFTSGISAYVAYGWSKESDDLVREYTYTNLTDKFVKLSPEANVLLGQSIWNFVAQRYGQRSISNILNLARIIRNEENSIARTLGLPYDRFMGEWRSFYNNQQVTLLESYNVPAPENIVSGKNVRSASYTSIEFSPDGNLLAYAAMEKGKYEVLVRNLSSNKEIVIFKGGNRLLNQEVDTKLPLISWADETTLGIITNEQGENMLTIKRVGERGKQSIAIPRLSRIQSFDFKDNGRVAVMTGDLNGRSDAFLYNINRGQIRRITSDNYDVKDARFVPESNLVVFSSNRDKNNILAQGPTMLEESEIHKFNVFSYDLDLLDTVFDKLTNALAMDVNPVAESREYVYYLSDQQGINNLYRHSRADSLSIQLSNFLYGIKQYDIDFENNRIAFVSIHESRDAIFIETLDPDRNLFTPVTPRRAQETTKILADIRRQRLADSNTNDTTQVIDEKQSPLAKAPERAVNLKEGTINTENYTFEGRAKVDTKDYKFERPATNNTTPTQGKSFLSIYQNTTTENQIKGPVPYETRFQTDNLVTTFVIDELRSFSQLMEIQMNDFLENHRFYGGLLIPYNFNSGYDVFGEYHYLKNRIDWSARYFRKSIQREDNFFRQRYNLNRFEVGAAIPYSPHLRLELAPFYAQARYLDLDPRLLLNPPPTIEPETTSNYAGVTASVVFDNSVVISTNVHEGTRGKFTYETHRSVNDQAVSFNRIQADLRHYQRLSRGVYATARVFYGSYFGDAPKKYVLGGVDNWAFNKTQSSGDENDPFIFQTLTDNSDLLFHQFTNLRGYDYNTFNGRNVLTFSAELRLPVSQMLNNKELRSNFLRNLQLVGFYDIGSAWDDLSPFKSQNNLNIEVIEQEGSPFSAVINNFNNPWLQSTGIGVRTMLFGFFSRLDLSWPIRNFEVQSARFQVSFGYDF